MSTVTIGVASVDEVKQRARRAFRGESQGEFITFPSVDVLTSVLTKKRWEIIQAMTGRGPMSVRGVTRLVNRDVKRPSTGMCKCFCTPAFWTRLRTVRSCSRTMR